MRMDSLEKKILLGVLICFAVSLFGTSMAYFVSSTRVTGSGASVSATTAELVGVSYDAGSSALSLTNAKPGDSASKTFSVTVAPGSLENTATYAIKLNISSNGFVKCTNSNRVDNGYASTTNLCSLNAVELRATLRRNNASGTILANNIDLTGVTTDTILYTDTQSPSSETTYTYYLTIEFVNTGYDQNHNKNKTFTGSISVEFAE